MTAAAAPPAKPSRPPPLRGTGFAEQRSPTSVPARRLLHHVPPGDAISLTALAEELHLPKSTTSVLVKKLADQGLVTRARDQDDERRLRIALTEQGRLQLAADTLLAPEALARALA